MIRRLARYLGPEHQGLIYRYLRWMITSCILQGATLALTIPILSNLLTGDLTAAGWWLAGFVVAAVVSWRVEYLATLRGFDAGGKMLDTLRYRLGDHVSTLPLGWFMPANTSTLGQTLSKGVMDVIALPVHHLTALIKSIVVPLVLIATLLITDWRIGLIALAALPPVLGVYWWAGKLGRRSDTAVNNATAEASDRMVEFAQAQPILRSFGQTGPAAERFDHSLREQSRTERRQLWLVLPPVMLNGFTVRLVLLALLATVIAFAAGVTDPVEMATLIAMLPIINLLVTPLSDVATHATTIRVCSAQMDEVDAILDARPLTEPTAPKSPADASIEYRGVGFAYDTTPILEGLDFTVPAGTTTAIVGPSGSGKTTIVRLAARFFDPQHGTVSIGGVPLTDLGSDDLQRMVAPVFQDNYLFSGTLVENLRVANPDASDTELRRAITQTGLDDVISQLPDGCDSQVGEGGKHLSGGERQRVAIARALLKDCPILLLDEATGSLDAENQQTIAAEITALNGRKTVLVVAHQLSTISSADEILFLESGRIVERGTHQELLALGQRYAAHWQALTAARTWRLTT